MAQSKGKRTLNKESVNKVNRTALMIGGVAAGGILLLLIVSFLVP